MRDLDGAVHRLDSILVVVVFLICVLILTAMIVRTTPLLFCRALSLHDDDY